MNLGLSNSDTPHDRIRYALSRASQTEGSWSARELFFLVKHFFPAETRSCVNDGASTLCSCGEFLINGRRYQAKALKSVKSDRLAVVHV